MAISQDMRANTTPIGPYFLSSEMTVPEKINENTSSIPTQNSAVATADGSRARHDTLPESKNHIVPHQKRVSPTNAKMATSHRPTALRNQGPPRRPGDAANGHHEPYEPTADVLQTSSLQLERALIEVLHSARCRDPPRMKNR